MEKECGVEIETGEAFYNPRMEMNRDITVAVLRAWKSRTGTETYLDANCATGVRGIRASLEGYDATLIDRSEKAVELARGNLKRNGVEERATVEHEDAKVAMRRSRWDVVDIDPFGTPIPFADAAFGATDSLACFTATDTAPLCGAHDSGIRRYSCLPLNTTYHSEMGLRVLIGALVRTGARYDVAATPVLSYSSDHYKRTYLSLKEGAKVSNSTLEGLGFVSHCFCCGTREIHDAESGSVPAEGIDRSCACGSEREVAGPVWTAPIRDREFIDGVIDCLDDRMGTRDRSEKTLTRLRNELDTPTHYDHHKVCQRFGTTPYRIDETLNRLREAGYEVSRTHYSGTSFKTDAAHAELRDYVGE